MTMTPDRRPTRNADKVTPDKSLDKKRPTRNARKYPVKNVKELT